jgi:dephospho-CoA kinase
MRLIGLTGGIASGKSTVAHILEELGAVIIDADQLSREVVLPGQPAHQAIVAAFGPEILTSDGTLDRAALGKRVFADPHARQTLEQIVHPAIRRRAQEQLAALRAAGTAVAVYMAPLLIEVGLAEQMDEVWVVYVNHETQVERTMARDGLSRDEVEQRLAAQMPMEEKARHGRIVIDNCGDLASLEQQVRDIWRREIVERNES